MIDKRDLQPDAQVLASFYASEKLMPAKAFAALIGVKPETESQMRARRQTPPFFRSGATQQPEAKDNSDPRPSDLAPPFLLP